ncbi:MAG: hypothetical protein ACFFCS_18520 [Candidatus Hodarchaeota archaeon]
MKTAKEMTFDELKELSDKDLLVMYKEKYKRPRRTAKKRWAVPKFQRKEGVAAKKDGFEFEIIDEILEIERVPGCICKFCLMQLLKPLVFPPKYPEKLSSINYVRFNYKFLKNNGKYQSGGEKTLMVPIKILKKMISRFQGRNWSELKETN